MRFNLRLMLAFVVSIAIIPIIAAAITFFFHENAETQKLPIALWNGRDLYVHAERGSMFIVSPNSVKVSTSVYLRIRQVFLPPRALGEVAGVLQKTRAESNNYHWEQVKLSEEMIEVSKDIHADKRKIEVRTGTKTLTTSLGWSSEKWSVGVHPENVCVANGHDLVLAFRTPTDSYLVSSIYRTYIRTSTLNRAGRFFFNTSLVLAFLVIIAFLWMLRRFSLRKAPPEISKNEPTNVVA